MGAMHADGLDVVTTPVDSDTRSARSTFVRQFARFGQWMLLGAASGALAGFLVGGVLGRVAMFVLRLTSPDAVIGRESDDGFTIGQISMQSLFLLAITTALGAVAGVVYVAARPALPERWRIPAWTVASMAVGGSAILKADGIDFTELHPRLLSVAMFIAIPAGGAALMGILVERRRTWWWTKRRRTALACIPLIVPILLFVLPLAALATLVVLAALASSSHVVRATRAAGPTIVRLGLTAVAVWGGWSLFQDVTAIL